MSLMYITSILNSEIKKNVSIHLRDSKIIYIFILLCRCFVLLLTKINRSKRINFHHRFSWYSRIKISYARSFVACVTKQRVENARVLGSLPVICVVVMSEYRPGVYCRIEYAIPAYIRRNVLRIIRYYVLVLRDALPVQAVLEINVNDQGIKQLCKDTSRRYMSNIVISALLCKIIWYHSIALSALARIYEITSDVIARYNCDRRVAEAIS